MSAREINDPNRTRSHEESVPHSEFSDAEAGLFALVGNFLNSRRSSEPQEHRAAAQERRFHADRVPTTADRFRVLVEQIPAVVFMVFLDGGISEAYVSPQIERMLGFTQEEWLDDPLRWYAQIHADDKERWSIDAADLVLTGKPLRATYRVVARDAKVVWFRCEAMLVHRSDGEPWFVHGVGFDVTELKETELALQRETAERERLQKLELERQIAKSEKSESRLAAIVESSEDAIIGKNLDGVITDWNAAATQLFGYQPREIVGNSIFQLVPPELYEEESEILRSLKAGQRIRHKQSQRLTKTGARVDVSLTISPIKDTGGRVIGGSTIARDITEQKRTEQQLRMTEKLAAAGRLAATIAHEINNPLEAVVNLLFLAKRRPANAVKYIAAAEEELERVSQITKQTLGFYRDTTAATTIDLSKLLDDVLVLYARKLNIRQITVTKDYRHDGRLTGFAGELRQVFSNLIGNAIDAMPNGGFLLVRSRRCQRYKGSVRRGVCVSIADTGNGIQPENFHRIFEPFFTTKNDVGTGLGLWLTKNIVERHSGFIAVRSRSTGEKTGSLFSVFLPEDATLNAIA